MIQPDLFAGEGYCGQCDNSGVVMKKIGNDVRGRSIFWPFACPNCGTVETVLCAMKVARVAYSTP